MTLLREGTSAVGTATKRWQCAGIWFMPHSSTRAKAQGYLVVSTIRAKRAWLSSSSGSGKERSNVLVEAVPFRYSADDAVELFHRWCKNHTPFIRKRDPARVSAVYVPLWSFECQVQTSFPHGIRRDRYYLNGIPREVPVGHEKQLTNMLQVYGGHNYRRPMLDVLKLNLSGRELPFTSTMMQVKQGKLKVDIDVDPYTMYEGLAWSLVKNQIRSFEYEELQRFCLQRNMAPPRESEVSFAINKTRTRKVYVSAYVIEYKHLGRYFRVFISGSTGDAYGLQQFGVVQSVLQAVTTLRGLPFGVLTLPRKLLISPFFVVGSIIASIGYGLAFKYSVILRQMWSFRQWHKIREEELRTQHLFGEDDLHMKSAEFWKEFEKMRTAQETYDARTNQQQEKQRQQRLQQERERERARLEQEAEARRRTERREKSAARGQKYDPDDHYQVLGLSNERASVDDVKKAFRREVMKWHPDTQEQGIGNVAYAQERTQHIIRSYNILRDPKV